MSRDVKRHQISLELVIGVASALAMIYVMSILFELPVACILCLFLSSLIALVWMVIRILKDPYSTDKTFDEYFYLDRPDLRRHGTE